MTRKSEMFLSETEVSERLGVSKRTLQTWRLQRRVLPFVRLGKVVRYSAREVEAYLDRAAVTVNG